MLVIAKHAFNNEDREKTIHYWLQYCNIDRKKNFTTSIITTKTNIAAHPPTKTSTRPIKQRSHALGAQIYTTHCALLVAFACPEALLQQHVKNAPKTKRRLNDVRDVRQNCECNRKPSFTSSPCCFRYNEQTQVIRCITYCSASSGCG